MAANYLPIEFCSEISVSLVDKLGSDLRVVNAARLSKDVEHAVFDEKSDTALIRSLIKNGHGTPFEKIRLELMVECPIYVAREWFKHRFSTFNEVSGRYTEYKPKFFVPTNEGVRQQVGKSMSYTYIPHPDPAVVEWFIDGLKYTFSTAYEEYVNALRMGIAKEVARLFLPAGAMYTKFMWGIDIRNLTNFLVLRNAPQALAEIREGAQKVEEIFKEEFPVVYKVWEEEGRPRLSAID